jgi:two-component sensor histidine kinase
VNGIISQLAARGGTPACGEVRPVLRVIIMPARTWRSPLRLLQIGSIVLPAAIIAIWGAVSWNSHKDAAFAQARSNVEVLREYALRVFETQQSLLFEAERLIEGVDVTQIEQREVHELLRPLIGRLRFTLGVGVISPDGDILGATSYPVSGRADHRTYFQKLRAESVEPNAVFIERVTLDQSQEALLLAKRRPGESFNGVLVAAVDLDAVTEFFARVAGNAGASASLVGSDASLLLRYPPALSTAMPANAPLMAAVRRAPTGFFEAPATYDDVSRIYGYSQLGDFPAFALFGLASQTVFQDWLREFLIVAALVSIAGLMAFAASTQAVRRVKSEERQRQLAFDRRLLDQAQREAESRGQLLREAHHRTKNNLQMILSMIRAKSAELGEVPGLQDIERRLLALAQVHDLLYNASDDSSRIDLGEFLENICTNPSIVLPESGIDVTCQVEPLEIDVAQAVPVALVAVEVLTNSLKHAFPNGRTGRIQIQLKRLDDSVQISIADDGIGLPPDKDRQRNSGLRLIDGLVRQLRGNLDIKTSGGTRFDLYLPISEEAASEASPQPAPGSMLH